jgi:DNA polymerase III epsilon subunit-like protein
MSKKELALLFIDTETTGLEITKDGIVQLSAVFANRDLSVVRTMFESMCNPGKPIPEAASKVHGFTDDMVRLSPSDKVALTTLRNSVKALSSRYDWVLAGHNVEKYDIPLMTARYDIGLMAMPVIDTYNLAIRLFPRAESHKLEAMYKMLGGQDIGAAHNATTDCYMSAHLLREYMKLTGKTLEEMIEWAYTPILWETWPWGKYKGKHIDELPTNMVEYAVKNFDNPSRDCAHTLQYLINKHNLQHLVA